MFIYAVLCENGIGVQPNEKDAAFYYLEAAKKYHVESMVKYASFLDEGKGVQKDENESLKWNKKALDLGSQTASCNYLYQQIRNEEKNEEPFNKLNELASSNSHALYLIGCCYENGYGCERNTQKAIEKFKEAAFKGHNEESIFKLIEFEENGLINEEPIVYEELNSNPSMMFLCGQKYIENNEIEKGLNLIEKASREKQPNSMIEYGTNLLLKKNFLEGMNLIEESTKLISMTEFENSDISINKNLFPFDSISYKTCIEFNLHIGYNNPDPNITNSWDWIPFIGDTAFNALEQKIDSVFYITGKGLHTRNSPFSITKQLVLLVTERIGFDSYVDPTNDGRIIFPISSFHEINNEEIEEEMPYFFDEENDTENEEEEKNNDDDQKKREIFMEIKKKYPLIQNSCIKIVIFYYNEKNEAIQFIEKFERILNIKKYEQKKINNQRIIVESNLVNYFKNLYHFDKEVIERVVCENETKESIQKVLDRIKEEIKGDFYSDFFEIVTNYDMSMISLLNIMKDNEYDKNRIEDLLDERSMIGPKKIFHLKRMNIYNQIKSESPDGAPKFVPLIEMDLRNAEFEKASRSIKRIMNEVKNEEFWKMMLVFSKISENQRCKEEKIRDFVEDQAKSIGCYVDFEISNVDFLEIKRYFVYIENIE